MEISAHLCFDGQCREAFEFYQQLLGGSIETMMTYGESPLAANIDKDWHGRIIHATLSHDDFQLMGVDSMPGEYKKPQGFSVVLSIENPAKAGELFAALATGGDVQLPFEPTFWSAGFGVLVDRFAVPWEINCSLPPDAEYASRSD